MLYQLRLFQKTHEFDDRPASFGFKIHSEQKPRAMADWVGALGEMVPGTGEPNVQVTIIPSEAPNFVDIVSVDGKSLFPHSIWAEELAEVGTIVALELDNRPYDPLKFKVTQNG